MLSAIPRAVEAICDPSVSLTASSQEIGADPHRAAVPPDGFVAMSDGIHQHTDKPGEMVWLCSPIQVLAGYRDSNGTGWGRLIELKDTDGGTHKVAVPEADLRQRGNKVLTLLHHHGLRITPGPLAAKSVVDMLIRWQPARRMTSVGHLGWTSPDCVSFVLGTDRVIGDQDILPVGKHLGPAADEVRALGTREDWKASVAQKCEGNPLLLLAVSLAFTGPLLQLLDLDLGGGVHLRGGSSRGKSTVLRAAASVWGSPGFGGSWRATANGLEEVAASRNGMIVVLDELAEISGKDLEAAIYMMANGIGKARAHGAGMSSRQRWRVPVLSAGEITVADKLAEVGRAVTGGNEVRLVDIEADGRTFGAFDDLHGAADPASFADALKAATSTSFGTAGPAFVEKLVKASSGLPALAHRYIRAFESRAMKNAGAPLDGEARRVLRRFALVATAGDFATRFGLTGWNGDAAGAAAVELFGDWLDRRNTSGHAQVLDVLDRLREHLSANLARIVPIEDAAISAVAAPVAWRTPAAVLIPREVWLEVFPGPAAGDAARRLASARLLLPGEGQNIMRRAPRTIRNKFDRVYTLQLSVLDQASRGGG